MAKFNSGSYFVTIKVIVDFFVCMKEIESEAEEFLKELDQRWPYLDADR